MNAVRRLARLALALTLVGLTGCVSLFPKANPSQLYRFGESSAAPPVTPAPAAPVIAQGGVSFPDDASTDRILTTDGQEAAYIKGARWISPAPVLFEEALTRAFEAAGAPRLVPTVGAARAAFVLNLQIQVFETRYDQGPSAAPEVVVQLRAEVLRADDRSLVVDQILTSTARASENRMGPIVQAYDRAVAEVLTKVVDLARQASA